MDDVSFEQTDMSCEVDIGTDEYVCSGTYTALECIPMTNYPDTTCDFDQVGDVTGTATWQWDTVPAEITAVQGSSDDIGLKAIIQDRVFTTCSTPASR